MNDYQPGAASPAVDPLADPAEADLLRRIAEAKALLEAIPVTDESAHRFLEKDALEAAALLKAHDLPHHYKLKRRLDQLKTRIVQDWKSGVSRAAEDLSEVEQKIAEKTRLIALAIELLELWRDDSEAWCWPKEHGPACCWRMPSSEAKRYLTAKYGARNQITLEGGQKVPMSPGRQAVAEALDQIEALAHAGARRRPPSLRVAGDGARLVLDLCRDDYSVVVVTVDGWEVVKPSPLPMRRAAGMLPSPLPVHGAGDALGDLRILLGFDGADHDDFWALVVGFMFAALRPVRPYFVFGLAGEQGTGKTTTVRVIRAPLDPHKVDVQPKPKSEDDMFVSADGQWIIAYDNMSSLSHEMSDALCRISSGTGYSKRKLCTDRDVAQFQVERPQIITSIGDVVAAGDLLDRTLLGQQPELDEEGRLAEEDLLAAVEEATAAVLGQLLDAAVVALNRQRAVKLHRKPRLVGPTKWVEAAAEALGLAPGQFLGAYLESQKRAGEMALEASVVGLHLESMFAARKAVHEAVEAAGKTASGTVWFHGTARALLAELNGFMSIASRSLPRRWPQTPQGMGRALHRIAPALRMIGYTVDFARGGDKKRDRWITIAPPDVTVPSDILDVSDISSPTSTNVADVAFPPATDAREPENKKAEHPAEGGKKRPKRPKRPNGPETGTAGSVPFMMTQRMKADLKARGFDDAQIKTMTPEQAHAHLAGAAAERTPECCAHCGVALDRGDMLPLTNGSHVHHRCADDYIRARDAARRVDPEQAITHAMKAKLRERGVHPGVIRELRPDDAHRLLDASEPVPLNAERSPQQDLRKLAATLAGQDSTRLAHMAMRYAAAGIEIDPETIDAIRAGGAVAYPVRDALWIALA